MTRPRRLLGLALVTGLLVLAWAIAQDRQATSPPSLRSGDGAETRPQDSLQGSELDLRYPEPLTARDGAEAEQVATVVLARNAAGAAVADAALFASSDRGSPSVLLGRTSASGELRVAWEAIRGARITAQASGYQPKTLEAPGEYAPELVLTLDVASSIAGTVVTPQGIPVPRAKVLVWNQAWGLLRVGHVDRALEGEGLSPVAEADERGRFVLDQVAPGDGYVLLAGGSGFASRRATYDVSAPAGDVQVTVNPVYGSAVKILLGGSEDIEASALVGYQEEIRYSSEGPQKLGGLFARPIMALAGVASEFTKDDLLRLHVFTAETELAEVPFTYQVSFPGYLGRTVPLSALRLRAAIPVTTVDLPQQASGFGSLELVLSSPLIPEAHTRTHRSPTVGLAVLEPMDSGLTTLTIPLREVGTGRELIHGIPFGSYRLHFRAQHGGFRYPQPGAYLDIAISETLASARIPTEGLSSAVLDITLKGEPFFGAASVMVAEATSTNSKGQAVYQGGNAVLEGAPYTIVGLLPGDYRFMLLTPHVGEALPTEVLASIPAGESVRVELAPE